MKNRDFRLKYRFISEIIQNRAVVAMECESKTIASFRLVLFSMTLSDSAKYSMTLVKHRAVSLRQLSFLRALAKQTGETANGWRCRRRWCW